MNTKSNRLLVVDDEPGIRNFLRTVAEQLDFEVYAIGNAEEFSGAVEEFRPTAIILDLNMHGSDGVDLFHHLARQESEAQVLVISGEDIHVLNAAKRLGSSQGLNMAGALQKPVLLPDLKAALKRVLTG